MPTVKLLCYKQVIHYLSGQEQVRHLNMARTKNASSSANVDWYLVSIERLKRIGLIALILLIAVGGYLYWNHRRQNPQVLAERAIHGAQVALDSLASSKEFNKFKTDYVQARDHLETAKGHFASGTWPDAQTEADKSLSIAQSALARLPGQKESDAQFLTVEGQVQYQKAGGDWKTAEVRTPLFNGDWVKTGGSSSAELMFSNGSLYTIGPSALLEIYALNSPGSAEKQNSVKMQIGSIEINTHEDISTVRTSGAQVVVDSKSTTQVGVDEENRTEVVSLRGSTSVSSISGGEAVRLAAGQQIAGSQTGELSEVTAVLPPPALQAPADNQVFQSTPNLRVSLDWADEKRATSYQLQVSRSRLFTTFEINATRKESRAVAQVSSEGLFYWRVASIDARGKIGPFSSSRRFRVRGLGSVVETLDSDKSPPALQVKRPFNIGGQFYLIEGKAEPGASVFINDEEIADVNTDGTFKKLVSLDKVGWNSVVIKAVDLAGNQTVQRERVYSEE